MLIGLPLGIWAARSDRAWSIMRPLLDGMQTIPAFVYLVPVVMLFGIGNVPGVIVTVIFAVAPLIRLTNLGIRQVPEEVVEAMRAFGATERQLLWKAQVPLAHADDHGRREPDPDDVALDGGDRLDDLGRRPRRRWCSAASAGSTSASRRSAASASSCWRSSSTASPRRSAPRSGAPGAIWEQGPVGSCAAGSLGTARGATPADSRRNCQLEGAGTGAEANQGDCPMKT